MNRISHSTKGEFLSESENRNSIEDVLHCFQTNIMSK